jgi:hypothetical protein
MNYRLADGNIVCKDQKALFRSAFFVQKDVYKYGKTPRSLWRFWHICS